MRILLDMNLTPLWCEFLTEAGHEPKHWSRVGRPDAPDVEILDFAREGQWVIITQDLDFGSLLALRGDDLPSVIQIRAHATLPSDIGRQVVDAIEATAQYLRSGALVTLTPSEFRVTALPIRPTSSD
jgi:predicted nuclease of predicted toxin-antitoxin system